MPVAPPPYLLLQRQETIHAFLDSTHDIGDNVHGCALYLEPYHGMTSTVTTLSVQDATKRLLPSLLCDLADIRVLFSLGDELDDGQPGGPREPRDVPCTTC